MTAELPAALRASLKDSRGVYANHRERELEESLEEAIDHIDALRKRLELAEAVCEAISDVLAGANSTHDQIAILRTLRKGIEAWRSAAKGGEG